MKIKEYIKSQINLQLFAEEPEGGAGTDPEPEGGKENEPDEKSKKGSEKKYTDEDVDKIINRKFAEWEKKQEQKISEAQKLAEMNAQEKAEYQRDELQKRLDEYERRENLAKMADTARGMLEDKNINVSSELLTMLVSENADKTKSAVESFASLFEKAVQQAVAEKLKGETPKAGNGGASLTKEQIMAVADTAERQKLINQNLELFKK